MKLVRRCLLVALTAVAPCSEATPMLESPRTSLAIDFANGDNLRVSCSTHADDCSVYIVVAGQSRSFAPKEIAGAEVLPWRASLFSGFGSGRASYYSFEVSVVCPGLAPDDELKTCIAHVLISKNEEPKIEIFPSK